MLSKSRILDGLQCLKRLYLQVHHPELAEHDPSVEQRFRAGHEVGAIARSLVPEGRLIEGELDEAIRDTEEALAARGDVVLFEGTVAHGGVLIRADILSRRGPQMVLNEVKSSTEVKEPHLPDVAVQTWTLRGAGLPVERSMVRHIDKTFVYPGGGQYAGLLRDTDVTENIVPFVGKVAGWVETMSRVLEGEVPAIETGRHCQDPYPCPFYGHCHAGGPQFPVEILPRGQRAIPILRAAGYRDLRDVPDGALSAPRHVRVWRVTKSGAAEIVKGAGADLASLPFPRFYVDFETAQMPVPIWVGMHPYEQLPFQWSCHIERADGSLEHRSFLDLSGNAPMRAFAESLVEALGRVGPVLTYSSFERTVLAQTGARYPDLARPLTEIINRLVDLHPLTKRTYYHPQMRGSWSIKSVIPTIAPELDYATLGEVQEGGQAQGAYLEAIHPNTPPGRRETLQRDLLAYCERDTLAMVRLARFLVECC